MKLNSKLEYLLLETPKIRGSYAPEDNLPFFEEGLTGPETKAIESFLTWIHENEMTYGHGTLRQKWEKFMAIKTESKRAKAN